MSLKRNIFFNGLANILSKTVRVAEQLLLVPFFLTMWGASYYGEWLTLSIIPSILAFSDLGFGSSASNSFVLYYSGGHTKKAFDTFATAIRIITLSILFGAFLTVVIMLVAYSSGLLDKAMISPKDSIIALSFMMTAKLLSFYTQLYEALYRAKRRAALSTNIITLGAFLNLCFGLVALLLHCGVIGFAISQFIASVLSIIIYIFIGKKIFSDNFIGHWNIAIARDIVKKGLGFMMTPIWQSIYFQGSTLAVRVVLGAECVAIYNTVRTVCRSVNQMYSIVNGSIFPEMQYEYGEGNLKTTQKIFVRSLHLVFIIAVLGVIVLCLFGPFLYSVWTHNTLTVSPKVWYVFMSGILFNAVWWTAGVIFRVVNRPYKFAMYGLLSSSISTCSIFILSHAYGLLGASIGYVLMDLIMAVVVLPEACNILGMRLKDFLRIKD